MAPDQSRKDSRSNDYDEAEEGVDQQSSSDPDIDVVKRAQDMVSLSKRRRESKRKEIEGEHEQRSKDLTAKLNTLFETRKNRVTKSQKGKWDRLDALNKKRSSLEGLILASMKSIELHSNNISNEMEAMFTGRIEDIHEATAAARAAKE